MLEEMKVKDVLTIAKMFKEVESTTLENGNEVRIVILQRGWVVVGKFFQEGHDCWIEKGYVIRNWGTERGLGELAIEGIKQNTKLDKIPLTKFHELTIVASMKCEHLTWKDLCK